MPENSINISELTQGGPNGEGVFDRLMQTVEEHIQGEFTKSRIRGTDYANVYLGSLQTTLDQSIRFLLERNNAELVQAQVEEVQARTALLVEQRLNAVEERENLVLQRERLTAEIALLGVQKTKTEAEMALLEQRFMTERAQVKEGDIEAGSVLGRQIALYKNQADGFLRDAEQKAAKLLADVWSVRHSSDPDGVFPNEDNQLTDMSVGQAVERLLLGIQNN